MDDSAWAITSDGILDGIRRQRAEIDGVMLALHGATATELLDDAEGWLLRSVRDLVGPDMPIAACFDLHAHGTAEMAAAADILVSFKTCPHIDYYEAGETAMRLLVRASRSDIRPVTVMRKLRLMTAARATTQTTDR